jgi:hypothetical protein
VRSRGKHGVKSHALGGAVGTSGTGFPRRAANGKRGERQGAKADWGKKGAAAGRWVITVVRVWVGLAHPAREGKRI